MPLACGTSCPATTLMFQIVNLSYHKEIYGRIPSQTDISMWPDCSPTLNFSQSISQYSYSSLCILNHNMKPCIKHHQETCKLIITTTHKKNVPSAIPVRCTGLKKCKFNIFLRGASFKFYTKKFLNSFWNMKRKIR